MQQYFIQEKIVVNQKLKIPVEYVQHIFKVLKMKNNDIVRLVDVDKKIFKAKIFDDNFEVIEKIDDYNELNIQVTAIIALIKIDKFELSLQKLVELGVSRIVVLESKRCVVKIKDVAKKIDRWNKIIFEAAKQSKRNYIPYIDAVIKIEEIINFKSELNYIAFEKANTKMNLIKNKSISFIIGPEGGFEDKEIEIISNLGFEIISLGKRILRAETASLFVMANIVYKNECEV